VAYHLGVDLGTTFVAVAIAHDAAPDSRVDVFTLGDRAAVIPAAVFLAEDGSMIVGDAALRQAAGGPDRICREFKRRMGDPTPVMVGGTAFAVTTLLGTLLQDVVNRVTETEGAEPQSVVLTHPASWGPYRRELFEEVPQVAGVLGTRTVSEPEAAAARYAASRGLADGEIIAVYDLGGGTFDATVLRATRGGIEILGAPQGIERLGGVDFDKAVLSRVDQVAGGALAQRTPNDPHTAAAMARLRRDCVLAKESLSVDSETVIPVFLPDQRVDVPLTRSDFENMIRTSIGSTIATLTRTLRSAHVDPGQLSAVLLVGGSSRIPLVARMVSAELGRPTVVDAQPMHAVALGAADLARASAPRSVPEPAPGRRAARPGSPVPAGSRTDGGSVPVRSTWVGPVAQRTAGLVGAAVLLGLALLAYVGYAWTTPAAALIPAPPPGVAAPPSPVPPPLPSPVPVEPVPVEPAPPAVVASVPIPSLGTTVPVGATPGFVVVSPNGRQAYVANRAAGVVTVLDTAVNMVTATVPVPAGPPQYLAFSPDGRTVYVSIWNEQRTIAAVGVLDTTTNSIVATIPVRTRPFLAAVTPDGKQLYVPNHDSGTISVIDTTTYEVATEIKVAANPHWVEFSKDGARAYTANHESNLVSVIDTATDTVLAEVPVRLSPHSVAVHPTRPLVADADYDSDSVSMIDTNTEKVVATVPVGHGPQDVTWAPDGRFAYVVNVNSDTVSVINAETMTVTATLPTGNAPTSVAVLPNGREAYVTNLRDGTVTVLSTGG
jgi:YVTN family beta-propeller protein